MTTNHPECTDRCSWKQTYDSMGVTPPKRDATAMEKAQAQQNLSATVYAAWSRGELRLCTRRAK